MNILFVCTGNTCRSAMAAAIMDKIAVENDLDVFVDNIIVVHEIFNFIYEFYNSFCSEISWSSFCSENICLFWNIFYFVVFNLVV